ncbi:hypothetical protein ACN38_g9379 [Penicillium nordicum]|uniref:Uncharacterized protein n=1 Tax=Penicillium nordicum TaxID=229535 RepID=A0A0M8NYC5_9EURO|nr:hypothetical protein ACN38_g9379 [Penicillium nordicum]
MLALYQQYILIRNIKLNTSKNIFSVKIRNWCQIKIDKRWQQAELSLSPTPPPPFPLFILNSSIPRPSK